MPYAGFSVVDQPQCPKEADMRSMTNEYTIGFVTPAFLGDSEQKGAWRTPPFKTLIRRWWRVVIGPLYDYDYRKLREREGVLFGHTCLEIPGCKGAKWAMKSQVQILSLIHI